MVLCSSVDISADPVRTVWCLLAVGGSFIAARLLEASAVLVHGMLVSNSREGGVADTYVWCMQFFDWSAATAGYYPWWRSHD